MKPILHDPPHPGEILREDVLIPLHLTVTEAAERLSVSRVTLSRVINEKAGISPNLAIRLELAGVSTARLWMSLQASYDLAVALKEEQPHITPWQEPDSDHMTSAGPNAGQH